MSSPQPDAVAPTTITQQGMAGGISGSVLKWIAVVTMLIDHIGVIILEQGFLLPAMQVSGERSLNIEFFMRVQDTLPPHVITLFWIYWAMRLIGRLAFPIFAFLIVEGFCHTRDRLRYAINLGAFAILSELPFNAAVMQDVWDLRYQNVFFTLLLGLLAIWSIDEVQRRYPNLQWIAKFSFIPFAVAAHLLHTDYGLYGVLVISLLYLLRENRLTQTIAGASLNLSQLTASLAFVFLWFYNGKRGKHLNKWFFYAFYPVHFLVLLGIRYYLLGF